MKKFISVLVTIMLLITLTLPVYAADDVQPVITVYKYDGNSGYNVNATEATKGDLLLVRVAFNKPIASLSTARVTLEFPEDKAGYVKGSFAPEIVPSNSQAGQPVFTEKKNHLVAIFGKLLMTDGAEIAKDVTNIASFVFYCNADEGNISFKVTLDNVIGGSYENIAVGARTTTATITLKSWNMTSEEQAVFEKLQTISYPNSITDINAADKIYNAYTAAEKLKFKEKYPELFEGYRTAWTRYYDASLEASQAAVRAEVELFVSENQTALSIKSPEGVTEGNYQAVLDAIDAYGKMTGQAQVLALDYKAQLDSIAEAAKKVKDRIEADELAQQDFIDAYMSTLWNLDESNINQETYADLMVIAEEAKAIYGSLEHDALSSEMKKQVDTYYAKLSRLIEKIKEVAKSVGEDEAIQKEIADFTQKWHVVTRLNSLTVGVNDKTAIEMMLQDFETLSPTAKQRLASRKTMAEQLLTYIGSLNGIQGSVGGVNTGIAMVPQGGSTQEVVKQIQVPVEKVVTQTQSNLQYRNVPTIVYVMIFLVLLAVLSMIGTMLLYFCYRGKEMKLTGGGNV